MLNCNTILSFVHVAQEVRNLVFSTGNNNNNNKKNMFSIIIIMVYS